MQETTMQTDWPAAHSMDTLWFAIDAEGHVATFWTSEDGHKPIGVYSDGFSRLDAIAETLGRAGEVSYNVGEGGETIGLFHYRFGNTFMHPLDPYLREAQSAQPLHVDQLPPALRDFVSKVQFIGLRFRDAERVQPLERFDCTAWNGGACAYVCADGKTVRPIAGEEESFVEFANDYRRHSGDVAGILIFDSSTEEGEP